MTVTPVPITALTRLNTHARATGGWGGNAQRDAIYAYKTLATLALALDGEAELRFVKWHGQCNRCTEGRYHHWDWGDGYTVACRDCGGTGQKTLRFTVATLPGGHVWHHPWEGQSSPGRTIANAIHDLSWIEGDIYNTKEGDAIEWQGPGEWRPLMPAERLPLAELVPLLNEVEDWVEVAGDRPRGNAFHWTLETARRYLRRREYRYVDGEPSHAYILDLGRAPGGCFVCGDDGDLAGFGYGRMSRLFHWSLPVCNRHGTGPDKVAHPKDPPPPSLITPDIARWLTRHEQVEAVG